MPDTMKIIEAVNKIQKAMDVGFITIHKKIDQQSKRLTEVETIIEVKKALCRERKEREKTKKDYWIPIIRAITIAGVLALLGIAGRLLIFGLML